MRCAGSGRPRSACIAEDVLYICDVLYFVMFRNDDSHTMSAPAKKKIQLPSAKANF